jgi:hypothetical protein
MPVFIGCTKGEGGGEKMRRCRRKMRRWEDEKDGKMRR